MADRDLQEYRDSGLDISQSDLIEAGSAIQTDYEPIELTPSVIDSPYDYQDVEESGLRPYKVWDSRTKSIFRHCSPEVKKAWLNTQRRADARAQKTIDAIKQDYREFDAVAEALSPFVDDILDTGMTVPEYLHYTIIADRELTNNPIDFICTIMDQMDIYNSDLDENFKTFYSRQNVKKQTEPIRQELAQLKADLSIGAQQLEQNKYNDMVYDFFMQKDDRGNLIYPYAEDLRHVMSAIIDSTGETDLDKVYRMAYAAATETAYEGRSQRGDSSERSFAMTNYQDSTPVFASEPDSRALNKLQEKDYLNRVLSNVASKYGVNVS